MKRLEREDLLRFYDHYISPRSVHRRKLSLHVNPSSLAENKALKAVDSEDELAAMTGEELPSTVKEENPSTTEAQALTEQPTIVDSLTTAPAEESKKIQPEKQLDLPKVNSFFLSPNYRLICSLLRSNGSIMFIRGRVNCHVIH